MSAYAVMLLLAGALLGASAMLVVLCAVVVARESDARRPVRRSPHIWDEPEPPEVAPASRVRWSAPYFNRRDSVRR